MNDRARNLAFPLRPAAAGDAAAIHRLLQFHSDNGSLLPRTLADIETNLADFWVADSAGAISACGALELFPNQLGEVRSLAVDQSFSRCGLGRVLVTRLIAEARDRGLTRLMALTYVPEFFHRLDFRTVPKASLPEKVWGICVKCHKFYDCDEIAVLLYL